VVIRVKEINYFHLFRKYKIFLSVFVLTTAIVTTISVYRQPFFYESTAKIFINDGSNIKILYAAIKSDQIYDRVVSQLSLTAAFRTDNLIQARKILSGSVQTILDSRVNTIEIKIRLEDARLAAEVANVLVSELEKIYPEIRLPETTRDPLDFKIVEKAVAPAAPIEQHKIGVIVLSIILSAAAAVFLAIVFEYFYFSSRGSKEGR